MTTLNRPDKVVADAYSDPLLETYTTNGLYYRWNYQLKTPILNAKGIQLINGNLINSVLQLNDASQLMFFYYTSATQAGIRSLANLRCVRLHPSNFVPYSGFTAYTKNKYYNSVSELVAGLNAAASTGGDSTTYNPIWAVGQVVFSYDTTTRKISVTSGNTNYIAPAPADDPNVIDQLLGTTTASNRIKMNAYNSSNTYASATFQQFFQGVSMNARLGYALAFNSTGLWWGASSQQGCATSTGVPQNNSAVIEADAPPILLGSQNVNVYLSIASGSGMDSWSGRKNLVATIPIEVAPYNINSYTTNSVEKPALSIPNEVYEIGVELYDDNGTPFYQPFNYNTELTFSVYY
jgi:hypothetical protein